MGGSNDGLTLSVNIYYKLIMDNWIMLSEISFLGKCLLAAY